MNSNLYNKTYQIPKKIIKTIQSSLTRYPHGDGVRRAKFIVRNGELTYQAMKRLKNFFDNYSIEDDKKKYELAGGDLMKSFVDSELDRDRKGVEISNNIKRDLDVDVKQGVMPDQNLRLNEFENKDKIKENALAVIIDNNDQVLLLKRSGNKEYWGAGKWALVGGGIEEGETPIEACQREIYEETGLKVNDFEKSFSIQRNPDSIEHIFIVKYTGDSHRIKLNDEHTNYGWYFPEEIHFLNHVPNLKEYVNMAFEKYI